MVKMKSIFISTAMILIMICSAVGSFAQMPNNADSLKTETSLPGQYRSVFTTAQDSAFRAALDMQIPFSLRARLDLELSEPLWLVANRSSEKNPWISAMNSFSGLPDGIFAPSDVEMVQWQTNIMNSMYVPFVRTYNPYGLKVDFETIGKFLGLVEDVTPVIRYNLSITADVEVVIYSIQASVVATLFKGLQSPGSYTINWNSRDDNGRMMPAGDYIAEVRIGVERYVRKRIVLK